MGAGGRHREFFTATELAALALPGLSRAKRKINELAERQRWALRTADGVPLARPRQARGGGLEYHLSLLPAAARHALAARGIAAANDASPSAPAGVAGPWDWYDRQPQSTKSEAERRAGAIDMIAAHEATGLTRSTAIATTAAALGIAGSTLWNWLRMVDGVPPSDRLPHLAPRRGGGGQEADLDDEAWRFLLSDYLRAEAPTFSSCYWRAKRDFAEPRGLTLPCERTLRRKLERELDPRFVIARRSGADALRATIPAQQRSVAHLHALEMVNIDGHKWDVFVRFPDGRIARPIMVAIQDVFSRKILAWRIGETESALLTRLAFADLFRRWGIPKGCLLDNGRAFASKWITGGAKSRFRFKIREEEPTGVLTALGVAIHWATPYRGQSKPIERAFRDLCDTVAKHPALAGAYTGNTPQAKPENYGDRAIDLADFGRVVALGIAAHNAKPGRRTEAANGRSFDQVFADSYAVAPIGRAATEEQLRLALLTADEVGADRRSGAIALYGNRYWTPMLSAIAGQRVTVRFDPDDLKLPVHVYDRQGRFLTSAPAIEAVGFDDAHAARARARQDADLRKAMKRVGEIERLMSAAELAALMPAHADEAETPSPSVIRPVRHRGRMAAAAPAASPALPDFNDKLVAAMRLRVVD